MCKNHIMFNSNLKEKYPFLTEYFESGLKSNSKSLSHSILLYGHDISAQYDLATEIARLLNCRELRNENCRCINCNWIREKQHPAVLTVSKIDNKPSDDESKTVISVAQARLIKSLLMNTSEYHRVFIFCDAKMEREKWVPFGLNEINFQEDAANTLLKTIEEPPENTTFFFLANDKSDLIETIISRSQSFFVPSYLKEEEDYSLVEEYFNDYPGIERKNSLDLAQNLFSLSKDHGSEKVMTEVQNFMLALLKSNLENISLKNKILSDIKIVEEARKMIEKRINPQLAFENMCLNITG